MPWDQLVPVGRRDQLPLQNAHTERTCLILLRTLHSTLPPPPPPPKKILGSIWRAKLDYCLQNHILLQLQKVLQGSFALCLPLNSRGPSLALGKLKLSFRKTLTLNRLLCNCETLASNMTYCLRRTYCSIVAWWMLCKQVGVKIHYSHLLQSEHRD